MTAAWENPSRTFGRMSVGNSTSRTLGRVILGIIIFIIIVFVSAFLLLTFESPKKRKRRSKIFDLEAFIEDNPDMWRDYF